MFAIALWDRSENTLILIRDRMGEKPLYYGWQGNTFMFASELKALRVHPSFNASIDRGALVLLLRHNCIPAPYSIYQGINKLQPGHMLHIGLSGFKSRCKACPTPYWRFNDSAEEGMIEPFDGSDMEAIDELESKLSSSVKNQMLSDVPLGAFLSGGVDSSTIVALMQSQSSTPVQTFTIGSTEDAYDEAAHAKVIAQHLGAQHHELYVTPDDARSVIPSMASTYCEPFGDSSQIPTYLVSRMARRQVTVALSGDGGDELFGGYNRYLMAQKAWNRINRLPGFARRGTANALYAFSSQRWDRIYAAMRPILPAKYHMATPGLKAHKLADVLAVSSNHDYYYQLCSHWKNPVDIVVDGFEPRTLIIDDGAWPVTDSFEHWMMAMDAQTFLVDDVLTKVDRAAMANSLETRIPMLDHRVVEFAWRLPLRMKIRNGQGKWLLRQLLYRHVPREMIERPKMGFGIPLDSWLRGPLREWAEDLLCEHSMRTEGYFRPGRIQSMWREHLKGDRDWQYQLWTILMFQSWLRENGSTTHMSSAAA
jgi:asparagine synthase (glutamine-hydrolysing)